MSQSCNDDIPVLTELSDAQVAEFLRRKPGFLQQRPELLAEMDLPHVGSGQAISLIERQVAVLRDRNMDMRHRLSQLLDNARNNDVLFEKTKRLILALADTRQLDDCLDALFFGLQTEFDVHFATLLLISDQESDSQPANQQARIISRSQLDLHIEQHSLSFLHNKRAICGQLSEAEKGFLFNQHADDIGSTAIAPLNHDNQRLGVLAIANRDPDYYRSSMNTLFLNFIADMLARLLSSYFPDKHTMA